VVKGLLLIASALACAGCMEENDTITCYSANGERFYHAEQVYAVADSGRFTVWKTISGKNKKLATVSGNCVVTE
jgi:hypothetical protein